VTLGSGSVSFAFGRETTKLHRLLCSYTVMLFRVKCIKYIFLFFSVLGFELRAYTLTHSTSPFFVVGFVGLTNYLLGLALNLDPTDLCLLSC
jgi:hypothetical protein